MSSDRDKLRHQKIEIKINQKFKKFNSNKSLSGGGGDDLFSGNPLPAQRFPPLVLFKKSLFGRPTIKIF